MRKITPGILAAAAIFGGGVMAGRHWARDTSETPSGPNRIRKARTFAGTRIASPLTPKQARYRATTKFQINQNSVPDLFSSGFLPDTRNQPNTNWFAAQVKAISSRRTLQLAVKNLNLETEWKRSPFDAAPRLAGMIKVEREPNANIVSLSAWSDNAEEATAIANGVRDAYEQQRREAADERLRRLRQNVDSEVAQQKATVENARREVLELINKQNSARAVSLVSMEAAERSAEETASRNLIEILEPAVALEAR